ncbi:hypothetical protein C9374_013832, partial [Naegleria lovaniensis]
VGSSNPNNHDDTKAAEPSLSSVALQTKQPLQISESTSQRVVNVPTTSPRSHKTDSALPNNAVVLNVLSSIPVRPSSHIESPLQSSPTHSSSSDLQPLAQLSLATVPPKDDLTKQSSPRSNTVSFIGDQKELPSSSPPKKSPASTPSASQLPLPNGNRADSNNFTEKKDPPIVIHSNNRSNIINTAATPPTSSAKNNNLSVQATTTTPTHSPSQRLSNLVVEDKLSNTISNPNYIYPQLNNSKMIPNTNNYGNNSIQYPSAPSFEEIEHHFPEYQPTMTKTTSDVVVEAQMQTMSQNMSFTPISDTVSSSSSDNSDDYKMFTQFKEFLQIQQPQSVHTSEEQLYELFLSFKERYEAQNNVYLNRQQATAVMNPGGPPVNNQQPILLNKSRVPVSSSRSSSMGSARSTPTNPNVSEKKRDGFKDVRRKYEEQYLEQIRLQQINRDHFAQQFQAPVMDYNALMQRENGATNNIGNSNNYPVVNPNVNSGDVIANGNYIPFRTNSSNNTSTTGPTWSEYLTFGYWK